MKKVIVIGLDGVTWSLLNPLIEKNHLPNIQKLMENGVWAILKSTVPPVTGPAWVSFATGKNPGKHGCYDFSLPQKSLDHRKTIDTTEIKSRTFYEELHEMKMKCILINMPVSHPPRIKEIVITSFLTKGENFVYPPKLLDEIVELRNYRVTPNFALLSKSFRDYVDDLRSIEKNRFECAKKLFKNEWDFFFILFSATDWIQHKIYNKLLFYDQNSAIKLYEEIDNYIGWFIDRLPEDANVFLMSDHGFSHYRKALSINGWLRREGFLEVRKGSGSYSPPQRMGKMTDAEEMKRSGFRLPVPMWLFDNLILGKLAKSLSKILSTMLGKIVPVDFALRSEIDVPRTYACSLGSSSPGEYGSIYINSESRFENGLVSEKDYRSIRQKIIRRMKELADDDGRKVFKKVFTKDDIYWGDRLNKAPDIVFITNEYVTVPGFFPSHSLTENCSANEHALNGVFVAYGPEVKKNARIDDAQIIDLAPTILHLMNVPISKGLDGRVLTEIFVEDSEVAKRSIVYEEEKEIEEKPEQIHSKEEEEKIKQRLRNLGYF